MKKTIQNFIFRLEEERTTCLRIIDNHTHDGNDTRVNINIGKVVAYNFSIEELQQIVDNQKDLDKSKI